MTEVTWKLACLWIWLLEFDFNLIDCVGAQHEIKSALSLIKAGKHNRSTVDAEILVIARIYKKLEELLKKQF